MYTYDGQWENDVKNGAGEMTLFSGMKYKGNYENNKKHGKGWLYYSNG